MSALLDTLNILYRGAQPETYYDETRRFGTAQGYELRAKYAEEGKAALQEWITSLSHEDKVSLKEEVLKGEYTMKARGGIDLRARLVLPMLEASVSA